MPAGIVFNAVATEVDYNRGITQCFENWIISQSFEEYLARIGLII